MSILQQIRILLALPGLLFVGVVLAVELPADFPADVPLADYMIVTSIGYAGQGTAVTAEAPGKSVEEVAEWFKTQLGDAGWSLDGEQVLSTRALLPFKKADRKCAVSVTDFVFDESMQMDQNIKGISIQLSGQPAGKTGAVSASATEDAATEDGN